MVVSVLALWIGYVIAGVATPEMGYGRYESTTLTRRRDRVRGTVHKTARVRDTRRPGYFRCYARIMLLTWLFAHAVIVAFRYLVSLGQAD